MKLGLVICGHIMYNKCKQKGPTEYFLGHNTIYEEKNKKR